MLLIDVSNVMYTGSAYRFDYFGTHSQFKLRSIPYFFEKIAAYYSVDTQMVAVFEKVGRIPALARTDGYKSGRNRNPLVEWEIAALRQILEFIDFPILEMDGQESDYIINNYCRTRGNKEDIRILSADHDIASNVTQDLFSTEILSFSSTSYNINKFNFQEITGVPYNFMNLHKLLKGCTSDKIKAFPEGGRIFEDYYSNLEFLWKMQYGYNKKEQNPSAFYDSIIHQYTSYESFMEWFKKSVYYTENAVQQLEERRRLVEGPIFNVPAVPPVDWQKYNQLMRSMNLTNTSSIKSLSLETYSQYVRDEVENILAKAKSANTTMFEGKLEMIEEEDGGSNIANILGLLEKEGGL